MSDSVPFSWAVHVWYFIIWYMWEVQAHLWNNKRVKQYSWLKQKKKSCYKLFVITCIKTFLGWRFMARIKYLCFSFIILFCRVVFGKKGSFFCLFAYLLNDLENRVKGFCYCRRFVDAVTWDLLRFLWKDGEIEGNCPSFSLWVFNLLVFYCV